MDVSHLRTTPEQLHLFTITFIRQMPSLINPCIVSSCLEHLLSLKLPSSVSRTNERTNRVPRTWSSYPHGPRISYLRKELWCQGYTKGDTSQVTTVNHI